MPASTSRPSKRSRIEDDYTQPEASASHLVSFLTGYDNRPNSDSDPEHSDSDGEHVLHHSSEDDEDEGEDVDDEAGELATPTKRGKTGLVGTPGSRATPSKRKTPTSTPRKRKEVPNPNPLLEVNGPGIIRASRADIYFIQNSRSTKTSGSSYSSLVQPLSQTQYDKYATSARSKGKSKASIDALEVDLRDRFKQWDMELEEGFGLLVYGFGSKRGVLNSFADEKLRKKGHVVIVNGFFPGLGIRDILSQIEDTLSVPQDIPVPPSALTSLDRSAHRIYTYFLPPASISSKQRNTYPTSKAPLYLVLHNIDSPTLRTPKSLSILSLLASSPNIRLIASFDHIHTPLLFSTTISNTPPHTYPSGFNGTIPQSRGFNWIYHNLTTYADYDLELSYQRLTATSLNLSSSSSSGISEEGALQILKSVPPMAQRLLKLLLTLQLAALPPESTGHGAVGASSNGVSPAFAVDNDTLLRLSREKFIAREQERFDALMGEFRDHGLVVEGSISGDGEGRTGRWVWVPLGKAAVERVLETMGDVEV
jgi:origin recognition complex subunit 2